MINQEMFTTKIEPRIGIDIDVPYTSSFCVSCLLVDTSNQYQHPYSLSKYTSNVHNSCCATPIDMILSVLESGEWDLSFKGSISPK